ncbi:UNVERIFIED_CONTAM: YLP motif-containing protein 1 [Sesamum latifolium]|uniref:YLP motif-containing protein 1 n=1 Tax=Sesamum latifolium TaxID=2727402 RepID=A0AAW2WE89_9LAMI
MAQSTASLSRPKQPKKQEEETRPRTSVDSRPGTSLDSDHDQGPTKYSVQKAHTRGSPHSHVAPHQPRYQQPPRTTSALEWLYCLETLTITAKYPKFRYLISGFMEYPWRLRPPTTTFCPVCSNAHFPPPPPLPPPPSLPPQPSYDPFVDHQAGPAINPYQPPPSAQIPHPPWNGNSNFSKDYYGDSNHGLNYDSNGQIGVKRMRVDTLAEDERRKFEQPGGNHETLAYENSHYQQQRRNFSTESLEFSQSHATQQHIIEHESVPYGLPHLSEHMHAVSDSQAFKGQPPLPTLPPPPLPVEPPRFRFSEPIVSSSASGSSSLFPIAVDSASSFQSPYTKEIQAVKIASSKTFKGESEEFPPRHLSLDKPKVIDASHILKHPHRANRPDHIVIILRGLPGSGKSYLAKVLRDLEVENGGTAPRIHSMDEYFMTEVEKVVQSDGSRSSGSVRGKRPVMKKVMEYCYEPEMEERSGYEVYLLEAAYKDPAESLTQVKMNDGVLALKMNHSKVKEKKIIYKILDKAVLQGMFMVSLKLTDKMANQWEEAPALYLKLDVKSLLHGDDLEENGIQEVDMDTEDGNHNGHPSGLEDTNIKVTRPPEGDIAIDGPLKDEQKGDAVEERPVEVVKELGKSKWSNDLDEDDVCKTEATGGNSDWQHWLLNRCWKSSNISLIIGPGSGYNLRSNPLPEEEKHTQRSGESRRRNIFQEQLRAEREAFKAAFDKRRHRICGLDADDE